MSLDEFEFRPATELAVIERLKIDVYTFFTVIDPVLFLTCSVQGYA